MKKPKARIEKFESTGSGHIYGRVVLRKFGLIYDSWWVLIGYRHAD